MEVLIRPYIYTINVLNGSIDRKKKKSFLFLTVQLIDTKIIKKKNQKKIFSLVKFRRNKNYQKKKSN